MTADDPPAVYPHNDPTPTLVEAGFDFSITEWLEAPLYVSDLPETTPETNLRAMTEQEYRKSTTPSHWHRYLTLGRYAVDGFTFDASMDDIVADPLKIHCIVWYNYMYHIDHGIDIPNLLLKWATSLSHQYLGSHADSALIIDTKKVSWKHYARVHSLSDNWSTAHTKHRKNKIPSVQIADTTTLHHEGRPLSHGAAQVSTPAPRPPSDSLLLSPRGTKRASNSVPIPHSYSASVSTTTEGTDPSLITTLNVKVCDGTKRVTFRMKLSLDVFRRFRVPSMITDAVYEFLHKIYSDDDGCLFDWSNHGTDRFGTISQMTPQQVRQFICPSITIMPDALMIILPIRYGYNGQSPSKWRNLESTQAILDEYNATVSFSNATSTSGKLVIAGYVLYKAPMTTHRKRWLDYLRTQLDEDTPPFDVLLHKRSPTGDKGKVLPHLAIQCGESHVHSLSEALAALLTGEKSPLYLPRFSFEKMTPEEAYEIFLDHDAYVKDLRSLPLSPLLRNLDRLRKEHHKDGSVIERTAREWARHLLNPDGSSMQADVVNGGDDLLCYLVFPSAFYDFATAAVEQYRGALYPFTHREARFRESIGPPPEVHLSKRIIANLDFVKRRIAARRVSTSEAASPSVDDSVSTTSSVSQVSRPMTSAESLRHRYHIQDQASEASSHSSASNDSTSQTTAVSSKASTGQISSQSAQFRDFQSALNRQKKVFEKQDTQFSDRFATIERQFYRFNDLDQKLEDVQTDFSSRLNLLEGRILHSVKDELMKSSSAMETRMDKLMTAVESVVVSQKGITAATKVLQKSASSSRSGSSSNESKSSEMSLESIAIVKSPDQKRLKSRERKSKKYPLKDSIRHSLDNLNAKSMDLNSSIANPSEIQLPLSDSDESMEHLYRQMDDLAKHTSCPEHSLKTTSHDLESQYTASQDDTVDNKAPTSPGRAKSP